MERDQLGFILLATLLILVLVASSALTLLVLEENQQRLSEHFVANIFNQQRLASLTHSQDR